jgi:hypothetical protein
MNTNIVSGVATTIFGSIYYVYRLCKIPNCLFRIDSSNEKKLCLSALYGGLIGPIKSLYLSLKYGGLTDAIMVFKQLFITGDNPITISVVLFCFWSLFKKE